ncbi:MoaD/ThiS family protein [Candidatus Saganbacteria bacterium]|nr:MoaD/ThiS family protein [Candidatus Saganbacteria bacterium]
MNVKVRIPQPLQKVTKGEELVDISADNVKSLIEALEKKFPGMKERVCDETGKIRRFINVYVNEEDIRFLQGETTLFKDGDEVSLIPAIAGGSQ